MSPSTWNEAEVAEVEIWYVCPFLKIERLLEVDSCKIAESRNSN